MKYVIFNALCILALVVYIHTLEPEPHDHLNLTTLELSQQHADVTKDLATIAGSNQQWLGRLDRRIVRCEMDVEDAHTRITEWHPEK